MVEGQRRVGKLISAVRHSSCTEGVTGKLSKQVVLIGVRMALPRYQGA